MKDQKEIQDLKIAAIIRRHEHWKSQWSECKGGFSRLMISPRGKQCTYSGYSSEVEKNMQKTIDAIRKVLAADAQRIGRMAG